MSFPAIAAAASFAEEPIDILTRPHLADLYACHPSVGRIFCVHTQHLRPRIIPTLLALRKRDYATVLIFPRSFRTGLLAFLIGPRQRIGYAGDGRGLFLKPALSLPADFELVHESLLHLNLVRNLSDRIPETVSLPPLKTVPEAEKSAIRKRLSLPDSQPYWVIAPGAAFGPAKRWPPERFAELGEWITRCQPFHLVATGSSAEREMAGQALSRTGDRGINLAGRTTLRELIALIEGSSGVIANDSGTMHLGALLGKPTIVPIGSTDPTRTGPLGSTGIMVRGEACRPPCRRPVCRFGDERCMRSISVAAMYQAFEQAIRS